RLVIPGDSHSNPVGQAGGSHNPTSGAPMTYGVIEDLKFAVEVFDEDGNLIEVLARLRDLDAAPAAYRPCRAKYPQRLLYLCQGGRILRRSDREVSEVRTL